MTKKDQNCYKLLQGGSWCNCSIHNKCSSVKSCGQDDLYKKERIVLEMQEKNQQHEQTKQHRKQRATNKEGLLYFIFIKGSSGDGGRSVEGRGISF